MKSEQNQMTAEEFAAKPPREKGRLVRGHLYRKDQPNIPKRFHPSREDDTKYWRGELDAILTEMDGRDAMRAGDHVHHIPTGQTWVVAWADHESGYMAACGWPTSQEKISDCIVVKAASDAEHEDIVDLVVASGRSDVHIATRIYRPATQEKESAA